MITFAIITFIVGKAYKQLNNRYTEFMSKLGEGDKVEKILSEAGYSDVAKAYILYRPGIEYVGISPPEDSRRLGKGK